MYHIIALCAPTLVIHVWSAVYIDIPMNKTFWNVYVQHASLFVIGIELLVFSARAFG